MAIYLNGQLVAGSNDGLKSITSTETVIEAEIVSSAGTVLETKAVDYSELVADTETVTKAETVLSASIVGDYTGQIEYIKNPGWNFDSTQLNTSHIYIQPKYDNIYIYAYCSESDTKQWFCYKIIGGEALQ